MKFLKSFLIGIAFFQLNFALHADEVFVDGIKYILSYSGNNAAIAGFGIEPANGILEFPSSIVYNGKSYPVTRVKRSAFENNSSIKSVSFPSSIKVIEECAFYSNSSLEKITFNEGLDSIKPFAFGNNSLKNDVIIPKSVKYLTAAFAVMYLQIDSKYFTKKLIINDNPNFKVIDEVVFNSDTTSLIYYPSSKEIPCYEVPQSVLKLELCSLCGVTVDTLLLNPNIRTIDTQYRMWIRDLLIIPQGTNIYGLSSFISGDNMNALGKVISLSSSISRRDVQDYILYNAFGTRGTILIPPAMTSVFTTIQGYKLGFPLYSYVLSASGNELTISFKDIYTDIIQIDKVEFDGRIFDKITEKSFSIKGGMYGGKDYYIVIYIKVPGTSYSYPITTRITTPSNLSGVDEIMVDNDTPAEYYNLQGLKVAEPRNGEIVIVRRGTKVTKEVYKQ